MRRLKLSGNPFTGPPAQDIGPALSVLQRQQQRRALQWHHLRDAAKLDASWASDCAAISGRIHFYSLIVMLASIVEKRRAQELRGPEELPFCHRSHRPLCLHHHRRQQCWPWWPHSHENVLFQYLCNETTEAVALLFSSNTWMRGLPWKTRAKYCREAWMGLCGSLGRTSVNDSIQAYKRAI